MRYFLFTYIAALLTLTACKKDTNTQIQMNGSICYQKIEKVVHTEGGQVQYTFNTAPCDSPNYYYAHYQYSIIMATSQYYDGATNSMKNQIVTTLVNASQGGIITDSIATGGQLGYRLLPLNGQTPINEYTGGFVQVLQLKQGGFSNCYIGFRCMNFYSNQSSYYNYGWMKVSYSADLKTFTIHECALNTNPDELILAGQY